MNLPATAAAVPAADLPAAGPSDVTEYFLIGSFTSWLIGLVGVALIYVA